MKKTVLILLYSLIAISSGYFAWSVLSISLGSEFSVFELGSWDYILFRLLIIAVSIYLIYITIINTDRKNSFLVPVALTIFWAIAHYEFIFALVSHLFSN